MKKKMQKLVSFALVLSMAAAVLAGCSSGKTQSSSSAVSSSSESSAVQNAKITFWTISLQPTFTDLINGQIKTFESKNQGITVNWVDLPYDSIQQKLITSIAGGTAPDVVNLNTQMALTLAGKNALVDLNKEATAEQKSIYVESLYNSAKIGDSVYAFPWYASPNVLIYNKALFARAGLSTPPSTYEQGLSEAASFKAKTGAYLFMPEEFINMLFLDNIPILSADKTKAAFNTDATVSLLNEYKTHTDAGDISKTSWGKWDDELKLFETGKLAVVNSSGSSISRIKDEAPDVYKNLAIADPLVGKAGISLDPLMNVVVPAASKYHAAAIAFANYITGDECQLAFCKKVAIFPSVTKAAADSYFTSDTTSLSGQASAICAKTLSKSADFSLGVDKQGDITDAVDNIYQASIMGSTPIASALKAAESKVNGILSAN